MIKIGGCFTRNRLISEANGKYIWFVDPDDLIYPNVVTSFFKAAGKYKADVVLGNYVRFKEMKELQLSQIANFCFHIQKYEFLPCDKENNKMCAVWAGIFSRKFLLDNNLRFHDGMIAQKDTLFYYEFALKTTNVVKTDLPCYLYRQRSNSIMHSRNEERAKKYYESMIIMYEVYKKHLCDHDYNDEEMLKKKIHHTQQNIAFCLAMLLDHSFVRREMRRLKKARIYPYPLRMETLFTKENFLRRICDWLLPIEPAFWILHYIYTFINRLKYLKS